MTRTPSRGTAALPATACGFAAYTAVMLGVERRMRRSGGPGIIAFELAGDATRAQQIMTRWGPDGRRAARLSLWLDFGYMLTYGALTALLLERARTAHRHPGVLPAAVIPAVAADAVEGVSLLKVLGRSDIAANARRARNAAVVKFAVLAAALGYCVIAAVTTAARQRAGGKSTPGGRKRS